MVSREKRIQNQVRIFSPYQLLLDSLIMFEETCSHFPGLLLLLLLSIPSALCKVCTFFSGFQSDYNASAVLTGVILWGYLGGCWGFFYFLFFFGIF